MNMNMKRLNRIQIKPQKLLNDNELITIRGGYGSECCECHIVGDGTVTISSTPSACNSDCYIQHGGWGVWQCII